MVFNRPRRSGKTTEIIKLAEELQSGGYEVLIITRDHSSANSLQRRMMGSGVRILSSMTISRFEEHMYRLKGSLVLSDEVGEWVIKMVHSTKHEFVVGYHTKPKPKSVR